MKAQHILFSLCALSLPFCSYGQNIDTSLTLKDIEVRSIRSSKKLAGQNMDILDAKQLSTKNNGQDVPILLQQLSSIVSSSDAGAGIGYTSMRIRGTDGTRINVTLNGLPVNDPESQGSFFVNFSDIVSSLNSLTVQRGIGSSTFGAGSFGANLSMNNLNPDDSAYVSWRLGAGSFNTQRATLSASSGWLKDKFILGTRLSYTQSDGFIDRGDSKLKAFQLNAQYKFNEKSILKTLIMSGHERTGQAWNGIPESKVNGDMAALQEHYNNNVGSLYFTPLDSINLFTSNNHSYNYFTYPNQVDNYQQDYYQLHFNHTVNQRIQFHTAAFLTRGRGYYEEYKYKQAYRKYGLPDLTIGNETITHTDLVRQLWLDNYYYGLVGSLFINESRAQNVIGFNANRFDNQHYGKIIWAEQGIPIHHEWYRLPATKQDVTLFAKRTWQLKPTLQFFADIQYRYIDYHMQGFRDNPTLQPHIKYHFLNPKVGISHENISGQLQQITNLFIGYTSKEPNRNDFEAGVVQQPLPEQLFNIELGYTRKHAKWQWHANAFMMAYKDQLILTGRVNDVGAYTRENVKSSYRTGLELMGQYQINTWLRADGNYTWSINKITAYDYFLDNYDDGGQVQQAFQNVDIAFSPKHIAAWGLSARITKNWEVRWQNKYVSKQYLDNTQDNSKQLKAYYVSDLSLQFQAYIGHHIDVLAIAQVHNVFNKAYQNNGYTYGYIYNHNTVTENFLYPQARRHGMLTLQFRWH